MDAITCYPAALFLTPCQRRPTAYFKDFTDYPFEAVRHGTVTIFGDGSSRYNPVAGADLAEWMADLVLDPEATLDRAAEAAGAAGSREGAPAAGEADDRLPTSDRSGLVWQVPVGGPQVLTWRKVVEAAAAAQGLPPPRLRCISPRLLRWTALPLLRIASVASSRAWGLLAGLQFASYAAEHDSVAWLAVGRQTVREYYAAKVAETAKAS